MRKAADKWHKRRQKCRFFVFDHLTNLSGGGIHNATTTGDATMNEYQQFTKGQKVRSVFGNTLIVSEQIGCMVYVEGSNDHYHPSKLFPVK